MSNPAVGLRLGWGFDHILCGEILLCLEIIAYSNHRVTKFVLIFEMHILLAEINNDLGISIGYSITIRLLPHWQEGDPRA